MEQNQSVDQGEAKERRSCFESILIVVLSIWAINQVFAAALIASLDIGAGKYVDVAIALIAGPGAAWAIWSLYKFFKRKRQTKQGT